MQIIFIAAWLITELGIPLLLIWGWIRWSKDRNPRTIPTTLSLVGFTLSSSSALLALLTALYARFIRSFPFYDPTLMKIYGYGSLLSVAGLLFGIAGVWRRGPLRWLAPACSIGMLAFWIIAMTGE